MQRTPGPGPKRPRPRGAPRTWPLAAPTSAWSAFLEACFRLARYRHLTSLSNQRRRTPRHGGPLCTDPRRQWGTAAAPHSLAGAPRALAPVYLSPPPHSAPVVVVVGRSHRASSGLYEFPATSQLCSVWIPDGPASPPLDENLHAPAAGLSLSPLCSQPAFLLQLITSGYLWPLSFLQP